MKRTFCFILILNLFLLCGCSDTFKTREPEQVIITSSLGFDNENGLYTVTAETIDISDSEQSGGYSPTVYTQQSVTVEQAIQKISDTLSGKLFLSHCAIIAVGKSITAEQLNHILNFCNQENEFTLAAKIISTENAQDLLKCKSFTGGAIGYDFLKLLNSKGDVSANPDYASIFYTQNMRTQSQNLFTLPCFSVKQEENEFSYYPNGTSIYKDYTLLKGLDDKQDTIYKILSNNYYGTTLTFEDGKNIVQANIEKSHCKMMPEYVNNALTLNYTLDITIARGGFIGENTEAFKTALTDNIYRFFDFLQNDLKEDLLAVEKDIEKKHPLVFKKMIAQNSAPFLTAKINVVCNIKAGEQQ